jgi:hypothetical protein
MKESKTFKAGESLESLAQFAKVTADELTGDTGEATLANAVRITVQTLASPALSIGTLLGSFGLSGVSDEVEEWIAWRRDDLRKPINSLRALNRLVKPFADRPAALRTAIAASMRHGWTGIFDHGERADRTAKTEREGSHGGEW